MSEELMTTTPSQDLAIDTLAAGGTTIEAADVAGVTRQTVSAWRNNHPGFIAALNTRRRDLLDERADRVRDLDAQALAVIASAIGDGNTDVAMAWVKSRHLHTVDVITVGPTSASDVIDHKAASVKVRPENQTDHTQALLDSLNGMTTAEARAVAEAELLETLASVD